mmetsp:Transcript_11924/g.17979  ORF Transcript_11924/g.17979 Transcript_11924/m.17979 type:complete len:216 (+) Transcript_11924:63-710(+)|eukprot:CAMPEP_0194749038 /NCGR_PEP_ID=MMETSP0323_2-20130528/3234_1 /TAXON_ID=2866 ORGANISM="Crypthecodinium cohnii, Strain Seligo" /NCGR_SAMPLE_ID=MMETSP0323_2 /ASSEMBLY_ACC=CAM_ASM_000346 /LENGTH=215 /DNA_ID=CAMNT_0039663829 /DNA_START=63 /DNA_END=710 /DNA_ORIENTATION=+
MALALSRSRLALRTARPLMGSGAHRLTEYSEVGQFSHFSGRMRYNMMLRVITDPTLGDHFYEKWVHDWCCDVPSYNYWFIMTMATGAALAICVRHWFFNPDIYGRKQEVRKPMPDRHRQWAYSLPYFNNTLRNICGKYKHAFIDNEPDYADYHPLGYRPTRKASHKRPPMWVFSINRYTIQDPLFTSCTHANMNRIYEEIGYQKKPAWMKEDEDA